MESALAPGTADRTSDRGPDEDYSPLMDGHGSFVDIGTLSGDHAAIPQLQTENLYADDLIGVSMSRVQTQMRSPDTPAVEKARALNLPVDYFQRILALAEEPDQDSDTEKANDAQSNSLHDSDASTPTAPFGDNAERSASPDAVEEDGTALRQSLSSEKQEHRDDPEMLRLSRSSDQTDSPPEILSEDGTRLSPQLWEYSFPPQPAREPPAPPTDDDSLSDSRQSGHDISQLDEGQDNVKTTHPPRLSITKNLLGGVGHERRLSMPNSTSLFANLRKLLPDLPTTHSNRSSTSILPSISWTSSQQSASGGPNTPTSRTFRWSLRESPPRRRTADSSQISPPEHPTVHDLTTMPPHQLDGNVESLLSPTTPGSVTSRPRSNSEGSLFIRRRVSGASAYDDITAFAHVTNMANSRFKAITDSFQNSTLKLPRLPAIRPASKRLVSDPQNGESSRNIDEAAPGPDGRPHSYHYTSVRNIRNVAKGVELETPQQRAHPILSHALSKATGDIVVLGGYRGSILRSAKPPHRQVWVPIKVGLNLRKVDLEVGLTREDEERMEETIIPDGVLSHIGPIDICRRLLKHLRKCPNTRENRLRVHNWGYDWRLSPDLISGKLIKFLESLESNHPETPPEKRGAIVIAHSLGGLITRYAVNQRPDLFAGVVYAGVPQHCINILGPLRNGDDVLLSSRVLTAQVNFTVRTSFALLPEDGRCFIQKHTNKRYDLDFFDPRVWDEYHLSPCINPPIPQTLKEKDDRRKSIIGALSETIIATNKRGSWFGSGSPLPQSSPRMEPAEALEEAGQRTRDKALGTGHDNEDTADGMVGPSMKQNSHRPSIATTVTIPKVLAEEYLDRVLAEVSVFKKNLNFIPSHQENNLYPPHALIFGKTVPTVYGARVANEEAIKYTDAYDDLAFAAGDGVVLASAAQLPKGYWCVKGGRIESDRGHVGIMGDLEGIGRCIEAVIDARTKGVGLGKEYARHSRESQYRGES